MNVHTGQSPYWWKHTGVVRGGDIDEPKKNFTFIPLNHAKFLNKWKIAVCYETSMEYHTKTKKPCPLSSNSRGRAV